MGAYTLRLCEDRLTETARLVLTACPRVVYVLAGDIFVTTGGGRAHVTVDSTWHGVGSCSLVAGCAWCDDPSLRAPARGERRGRHRRRRRRHQSPAQLSLAHPRRDRRVPDALRPCRVRCRRRGAAAP